jgi:hypothetical protein
MVAAVYDVMARPRISGGNIEQFAQQDHPFFWPLKIIMVTGITSEFF